MVHFPNGIRNLEGVSTGTVYVCMVGPTLDQQMTTKYAIMLLVSYLHHRGLFDLT